MRPKRLFITGIPTAGKSWAGNLIATELKAVHIEIDDMRVELQKDPAYRKWANFYFNLNEKKYFESTSHKEQWDDIVRQSEGLWPAVLKEIKSYEDDPHDIVFEGSHLLPHLMHRDLPDFQGIVLLGPSFEKVLERDRQSPRWGHSEELIHMEAESYFYGQRPRYKEQGEKYGYEICDTAVEAFEKTKELWNI
jgi:hypothetical protein